MISAHTNNIFLLQNWENTEAEIQAGDIVIHLQNDIFPTDEPTFKSSIPKESQTPQTQLPSRPGHIVIATSARDYVHAYPMLVFGIGFFDTGSNNNFETLKEGRAILLRSKNSSLQKEIARFAQLYEVDYNKNPYRQTVPFAYAHNRRLDRIDRTQDGMNKPTEAGQRQLEQLELFRAFRAYSRLITLENNIKEKKEGAPPLSKNKGVSCSNFASYIVKSAVIATRLPAGLEMKESKDIKHAYDQIERSIPKLPLRLLPEGNEPAEDGCYIKFAKECITCVLLKNKIKTTIDIPISTLNEVNNHRMLLVHYENDRTNDAERFLRILETKRAMLFDILLKNNTSKNDLSFLKTAGKLDTVLLEKPELFQQFLTSVKNLFSPEEVCRLIRPVKETSAKEFAYSAMADTDTWKGGICIKGKDDMVVMSYESYQKSQEKTEVLQLQFR